MKIRLMEIEDYEKVFRLWSDTVGMGMRSLDDSFDGISKFISRNPNTNFVAEMDSDIVGVILSGHDGRRGYIYHMAVGTEYRRNGIGKLLLNSSLVALKNEGIHKVALVVFDSNDTGNKFWESVGFAKRSDLIYRNKSINENNV